MVTAITDASFGEVIDSAGSKPVIIDFWAPWCGPCRMMSPIIDEMAEKFDGQAIICKCNVDECADLPVKYLVRNIPTVIFLKNGQQVDKIIGAVPKSQVESKISALV